MRVVGVEWNTHPRSRTINAQSWCDLNQLQKTRFGENVTGGRFLCPKLNNLWEKQLWEASQVIKEALLRASINHFTFRAKKGFGRSTHANGTIAQWTQFKTFFWRQAFVELWRKWQTIIGWDSVVFLVLWVSVPFLICSSWISHSHNQTSNQCCWYNLPLFLNGEMGVKSYICNLVSKVQLVWSPGDISPPVLLEPAPS